MKTHRFASHSPEEQRRLSNVGHRVEGLLLAVVGILALLGNVTNAAWAGTAWPIFLLIAGGLLLISLYLTHPIGDWLLIWNDPQQRQHTIMAASATLAGIAEMIGWVFVWPLVTILIGTMFLTHTQHGQSEAVSRAVLIHRILGVTIILAGLLRAAELITGRLVFAALWPIALLVAAVQLLIYREPEGAFEAYPGHEGHT